MSKNKNKNVVKLTCIISIDDGSKLADFKSQDKKYEALLLARCARFSCSVTLNLLSRLAPVGV
jgi:hypothetical protein